MTKPQTSQEKGPREFFLSPNKIKTALAMVPHYIAFDKAQTQESIHTIEIRAYQSLQQKVSDLEAENKRFREALEFYANENNWILSAENEFSQIKRTIRKEDTESWSYQASPESKNIIQSYGGKRARQALKGEEK